MRQIARWIAGSSVGALLIAALTGCPPGATPVCPPLPTPSDWGPVATMSQQSSVDIELGRLYVNERVRSLLETPPTASSGTFVRTIDLKDVPGPGNAASSVLELRLEPWLLGSNGQPASLQRFYRLTLKITPHIVTPATVPDQARRKQLLCPATNPNCAADQGALLSFDYQDLYNVSFSRPACTGPDSIDAKVVPVIFNALAGQGPLLLPTESISAGLASAGGGTPNLVDVNVSADGFLKVGLRYNVGTTHAFDRHTMLLSRFPNDDWVVDIDKSILAAAVRARMLAALTAQVAGSTITSFTATFSPGEIQASGTADLPVPGICGTTATVTIDAHNPTQICMDATGTSAIVSWTDATNSSGNFCVNFVKFWDSIGVGIISGPPTVWPTLTTVNFPADAVHNDVFFGTHLDLDNAFAIAGRSTLMDRKAVQDGHPRSALPGKCPGVP